MPKIIQLDPHVADLIAAGEVVERPASVVKELTENSIDAGARTVTVEIQRGGMSYIRVADDGCGIAAEDTLTAFLRHATSKIRTEYDLEAIGTLGFRGEALAAIASVAKVELITRTEEENTGVALLLDGGVVRRREEAGCPVGTTMIVRDLFFNTPARQKFMKRDAAEGSAVFSVVQHVALSHPEVSFRLIRDGKQDLHTPGDGDLQSAVYAVLGRDVALGLLDCRGSGDDIRVEGFISQPVCCRGSRSAQFFFVNGRTVKSRILQAALEQAYQNQKMVGKFPACVLHIRVKQNAVDVNVHPTKTEVKFSGEKKLFDAVYGAVKAALDGLAPAPEVTSEQRKAAEPVRDTVTPNQTFFRTMNSEQFRGELHSDIRAPYRTDVPHRTPVEVPETWEQVKPSAPRRRSATSTAGHDPSARPTEPWSGDDSKKVAPAAAGPAPEAVQSPSPAESPDAAWRLAGEVLNTYIVAERGEEIWLIDKHAAHERMNFDRLKAMDHRPMRQILITPLILHPAPEEYTVLLAHLSLLEEFGFAAEDFSGGSIVVREAPDDLAVGQIESTLGEIAAKLLETGSADPSAARDEVLHTMACKSAIKGGWKSAEEELLVICEEVFSGRVRYCPHGRPVAVRLTRQDLEKWFKRR